MQRRDVVAPASSSRAGSPSSRSRRAATPSRPTSDVEAILQCGDLLAPASASIVAQGGEVVTAGQRVDALVQRGDVFAAGDLVTRGCGVEPLEQRGEVRQRVEARVQRRELVAAGSESNRWCRAVAQGVLDSSSLPASSSRAGRGVDARVQRGDLVRAWKGRRGGRGQPLRASAASRSPSAVTARRACSAAGTRALGVADERLDLALDGLGVGGDLVLGELARCSSAAVVCCSSRSRRQLGDLGRDGAGLAAQLRDLVGERLLAGDDRGQ